MKKLLLLFGLALVSSSFALAQAGRLISVTGGMDIQEGGTARVLARVTPGNPFPLGYFGITFNGNEIKSVRISQFDDWFSNEGTGFFAGRASMVIMRSGVASILEGRCAVMVDDLDHSNLPFPDQFFLHFTVDGTGEVIVRHGLLTRGDVILHPW